MAESPTSFVMSNSLIDDIHEGSMSDSTADKLWDAYFAMEGVGITSESHKSTAKNIVNLYFIRNAYSERASFSKVVKEGEVTISFPLLYPLIKGKVRHFASSPKNVRIQAEIMAANPGLAEKQANKWHIVDTRLYKYCFEGSQFLPELRGEDKAIILAGRQFAIKNSTPFVRQNFVTLVNDNTGVAGGRAGPESGGGSHVLSNAAMSEYM
jgi:hypothetical protein